MDNQSARGISRTIAERYWHGVDPVRIEEMAMLMVQE